VRAWAALAKDALAMNRPMTFAICSFILFSPCHIVTGTGGCAKMVSRENIRMKIIAIKAGLSPLKATLSVAACTIVIASAALVSAMPGSHPATAQSAPVAANIAGQWRTDDNKAIVTIAPCAAGSAAYCGRITRMLGAQPAGGVHDENNPNAALRNRPVLGISIFNNLTRNGTRWTGRGYSPEDGRNFNATLTTEGNQLNVRGCVAVFCRNRQMVRVN
jgi:uncharacterized protein (DUF2147 family)